MTCPNLIRRLLHLSVSTFIPRVFLSSWWMMPLMSANPLDCPSVFAPVANQPPRPCICLPAPPWPASPAPTLSLATVISHLGLLHEFLSGTPLLVKPKPLNMVPKCPSGLVLLSPSSTPAHPLTSSNSGYGFLHHSVLGAPTRSSLSLEQSSPEPFLFITEPCLSNLIKTHSLQAASPTSQHGNRCVSLHVPTAPGLGPPHPPAQNSIPPSPEKS